jgi:2'-5' RNA ligase
VSRSSGARLFVAADLPAGLRESLAWWAREARRGWGALRLLDSDLLHVTLCFLGPRPVAEIETIAAALVDSAAPVQSLGLGAPVWLPARRPRTLAVEVRDAEGALAALVADLTRRLAVLLDWEPQRRRYRPHVTVARMRAGSAPRERVLPPTPAHSFVPEALTLYRSWLSAAGASYEPLARVPLDPAAEA